MKDFFKYAKNRVLYNIFRILIVFGICFLIQACDVYAESYTGSATWMYLRIYNSSGTFSKVKHCGGSDSWSGEGQYGNYCIIEPDDVVRTPGAQFNVVSPFTFTKDKQYKIKLTTLGIRADKVSNITVQFTTSSNSYTGFYTFNSFAGVDTDYLDSTNWVLTFIPTTDVTVKEMNFKFTFEADNSNDGYGMWSNFTILDIDNSSSTIIDQNETIINQNKDIINKQDETKNAINNLKEQEQKNHEETKEEIKKGFEECRDSYNLFNKNSIVQTYGADKIVLDTGVRAKITTSGIYRYFGVEFGKSELLGKTITLTKTITPSAANTGQIAFYFGNETFPSKQLIFADKKSGTSTMHIPKTFPADCDRIWILFYGNVSGTGNVDDYVDFTNLIISEGSTSLPYEQYGKKICKNRLDAQREQEQKNHEKAEETRKGIWQTIKDLPGKILDMLKGLFIPGNDYFSNWFNSMKTFFEEKLGFLVTPFDILFSFINNFLDLNDGDAIINIPNITVPNFENSIIIKAQAFNWSDLLKSKPAFKTLWNLYLDFVDVFLIVNFLNLSLNTYNRIVGNNDISYDYYTVEDSYSYDVNTGEVLSARRNERKTQRKRSDKK